MLIQNLKKDIIIITNDIESDNLLICLVKTKYNND